MLHQGFQGLTLISVCVGLWGVYALTHAWVKLGACSLMCWVLVQIRGVLQEVELDIPLKLLLQHVIIRRLRTLDRFYTCASEAVPSLAPVFNIPKLPLNYYGLLTAQSGSAFFRGLVGKGGAPISPSRPALTSSKMVLQVGPSDLPIEMSVYLFLRPLLTNEMVESLWRSIVEKLGYSSREQPSLRLDRGQAATAKLLQHTLWCQATMQLLSATANPCRLRARVGDRPFLVVFRGEGATDFGGPFQEFLSGVANEVMGAVAETPDAFLSSSFMPCLPCLNSTHAIGPHQDSVVLRPDPRAALPDPLVSAADLRPPPPPEECSSSSSSNSSVAVSRLSSAHGCTERVHEAAAQQADASSCLHAVCRPGEGSPAPASPHNRRLRHNLQAETLWTSDTILSALPSPARRVLPRGHDPDGLGLPYRDALVDPFLAETARLEKLQGAASATSRTASTPRQEEEAAADDDLYILMYEALGRLMAMCLCIGSAFNVTLNPLLWKKLVAAPLSIEVRVAFKNALWAVTAGWGEGGCLDAAIAK